MSCVRRIATYAVRAGVAALFGVIAAVALAAAPVWAQGPSDASWVAPDRAAARPNPVEATPDAIRRGRIVFQNNCTMCHGKAGHGDGMQARSLSKKPANLASADIQSQPDGALFWKIREGRGDMPSTRSSMNDHDRWSVVNYLRTLAAAKP
jgi:mono/diheme cytochrome c family protein